MADNPKPPSDVDVRTVFARNKRLGIATVPYPRELAQPSAPSPVSRLVAARAHLHGPKSPEMVMVEDLTALRYSQRVGRLAAQHRLGREGKGK
jgi:hypothetical protein